MAQCPSFMVKEGRKDSPSTGKYSFQSLSEEDIYAWQPADATDFTAPAVRSKIRNSVLEVYLPLCFYM